MKHNKNFDGTLIENQHENTRSFDSLSASPAVGDLKLIAFAIENTWLNGLSHGWGNGYVAIPKGHPCYGMDYNEIHNRYEISINGGLTYSDKANKLHPKEVRENDMWIVGFDTCHSWDTRIMWPNEASVMKEANNLKSQLENLTFTQDWKENTTIENLKAENTKLAASNLELLDALREMIFLNETADRNLTPVWQEKIKVLKQLINNSKGA